MPAPRFVLDEFWPSDLFLGGIPGAWYDPTDLSTMFQNNTGTTPVTAVEQPVGLILDKSQGLALGPDLITNGGPFVNTTGWTAIAGATLSVDSGRLKVAQGLTDFVTASQAITTVAGRTYRVTYDLVSDGTSSPAFVVYARQGAGILNIAFSTTGFGTGKTLYFTAVGTTTYIEPGSATSADNIYGLFNNIKVELVAGNHASQATSASRPTYRARYNLLTYSEEFENAVWAKGTGGSIAANTVTAPDGTSTADAYTWATSTGSFAFLSQTITGNPTASNTYTIWLKRPSGSGSRTIKISISDVTTSTGISGDLTVTETWQRFTFTRASGTNTGHVGVGLLSGTVNGIAAGQVLHVWGAQLLTAADVTATGNEYQRIAAATVYDTAPIFRPYLAFDGVDDSLSTATISGMSSIDKATFFGGVTKLADGAYPVIFEYGVRPTAGSIGINASSSNPRYFVVLEGTSIGYYDAQTYTAPTTNVLACSFDIGGATLADEIKPRINGVLNQTNPSGTSGTGNFGAYSLFIGRRNNASLPYNGRIYAFIFRGAASSVTEIFDAELWVNARTGAY